MLFFIRPEQTHSRIVVLNNPTNTNLHKVVTHFARNLFFYMQHNFPKMTENSAEKWKLFPKIFFYCSVFHHFFQKSCFLEMIFSRNRQHQGFSTSQNKLLNNCLKIIFYIAHNFMKMMGILLEKVEIIPKFTKVSTKSINDL